MSSTDTVTSKPAPILILNKVTKTHRARGGLWRQGHYVSAVRETSLTIQPGEVYGLVGESGSGKSSLARLVLALDRPTSGEIMFSGVNLGSVKGHALRNLRRGMQMIFQNPYSALDPLMTIGDSIEEPLKNFPGPNRVERQKKVWTLLRDVGLPTRMFHAYPYQLSGGELQRACIARALALRPGLLVCDEPVSALDKTIQAQILRLLAELRQRYNLTYLFISHDLAVVNQLCDRVAVMLHGNIIEEGEKEDILFRSRHPYTQTLMAAARYFSEGTPLSHPIRNTSAISVQGCAYQDRCAWVQSICRHQKPALQAVADGHRAACHIIAPAEPLHAQTDYRPGTA